MPSLTELARDARVYDLAQPYYVGMPHYPTHPPFLYGLTKQHGEFVASNGASSAADAIALGTHTGTHIDALCHFSCGGHLHGGVKAAEAQSAGGGLRSHGIDTVTPILRRGVLLDIAGLLGGAPLEVGREITPAELDAAVGAQKVAIAPGDVVLLRTGWAQFWGDAGHFISQVQGPGPCIDGARWLSERGVFAAGADTAAFERVPAPEMAVHVHLLVEKGIHIIECLNLETLAAERVWEFLFIATPLKITGATGSPIRPLALVERTERTP